jgi:RecJ-like exonuclease
MHSEVIGERNEEGFSSKLKEISSKIKNLDNIVVVHHYDADGLTSGAIVIKALQRENKTLKNVCLKQLYRENVEEIKSLGKNFLFVDFGSGQTEYLVKEFDSESLFILDHHQPSTVEGKIVEVKYHANPLLFGIDGGNEISGAGVAYLFAKNLNEKNKDLSPLAIVGAVGDMQESRGQLFGMNRTILDDALKEKIVSVKKDLRLYGRISRPLTQFLCFSSSPILPELTAQQENCVMFLNENKIPLKDSATDQWLSYEDLSLEKKQTLISALVMHLSLFAVPEWKIKEMIGEVYTLEEEDKKSPLRDAKEFATALNSCGRHARPQVGLDVCLGDRNIESAYGELLSLIAEHRIALAKGIQFVSDHGVSEKKSFYFFDAGNEIQDSLVGIIAGMLYGSVIDETKPIIALAKNTDGTIKVSGRGTSELLRRGLNLGLAFKEISTQIPGVEGGGHKIAAGCKVPFEKIEEFLAKLEEKLFEQIKPQ